MKYRWILKPSPKVSEVVHLAKKLSDKSSPSRMWFLVASLLVQRGINSFDQSKRFFRPSLEDLHNPYLMKGMQNAVDRILHAIENQQNILIYGDYDVDGTSSVSLMYSFLSSIYPNVSYYIPDRYTEGYGISLQGIDYAYDNNVKLIISLDCGTKDVQQVAYAQQKGIDFIICDHHRPSDVVPSAVAVLNPKQDDCPYPYKELCGCGVGFKLVQALVQALGFPPQRAYTYLDLTAIATAADIVPLTGENRILIYYGIQKINQSPSQGIKAMIEHLPKPIHTTHLVFTLAPRINAAGRIKHAQYAVKLLTQTDTSIIKNILAEIEEFNTHRKHIDQQITQQALEQILSNEEENRYTSVVFGQNWHKGVIGIVASRLIETYYRPTIVFTGQGDTLSASARSVAGFDIYEAIEQCSEFVTQFGGHKYAAGLTISAQNYLPFKQRFEQVVSQSIAPNLRMPQINIDTEISLEDITANFYHILKQFAPFGPQNMAPIFLTRNISVKNSYQIGKNKEHLRLQITDDDSKIQIRAIGFGLGHKQSDLQPHQKYDIVYTIEENTWQGITSIQIQIRDIQ